MKKLFSKRSDRKEPGHSDIREAGSGHEAGGSGNEEIAAIALALKLYQEELHIREAAVITINRVSRIYSPWSSKIHGIRQIPERKQRR